MQSHLIPREFQTMLVLALYRSRRLLTIVTQVLIRKVGSFEDSRKLCVQVLCSLAYVFFVCAFVCLIIFL